MGTLCASARAPGGDAPAVEVTRGPDLQVLLADSVEILWHTSAAGVGAVWHREEGAAGEASVATEAEPRSQDRVKLSELSSGVRYRYAVLHEGEPITEEFGFRTSPGREGMARLPSFEAMRAPERILASGVSRLERGVTGSAEGFQLWPRAPAGSRCLHEA